MATYINGRYNPEVEEREKTNPTQAGWKGENTFDWSAEKYLNYVKKHGLKSAKKKAKKETEEDEDYDC